MNLILWIYISVVTWFMQQELINSETLHQRVMGACKTLQYVGGVFKRDCQSII